MCIRDRVCLAIGYAFLESLLFKIVPKENAQIFTDGIDGIHNSLYPCFENNDKLLEKKDFLERYRGAMCTDDQVKSFEDRVMNNTCLLYTSPSPRDQRGSRMPSSA
eukprot:TRINITY_DN18902_c0_g1_i1.p2 TRINITY_DN18902_c0_g1~~TRINITY_DN18902_c0_g1_i1.p2  ORF type:complete len:106 (+),score=49.66 TRINITY_DN18902_c0_g1_i1:64-381(+)